MWSACDVILRDGAIAHLRPVSAGEGAELRALHARMSDQSSYFRFFSSGRSVADRYVDHLIDTTDPTHGALVAVVDGCLVGVAGYEKLADPARAEISFVVEEAQHGRGVGTLLLEHLAAYARDRGVTTFVAQTHAQNTGMLGVFADAGFPVRRHHDAETIDVTFPVAPTESLLVRQDGRESEADVRSLRPLLRPRSVAVIGASRRPRTVGHEVVRNIVAAGFTGSVHVVNPHATEVAGIRALPSVRDLPGPIDLAVVAVPAPAVDRVVESCARAGIRAMVILTAGFAQAGGRDREAALVSRARAAGMRVVGPNCLGVMTTAAGVRLNATFARVAPRAGGIAVVTQPVGLGIALLEQISGLGLGLSTFVSTGDKADVSGNDLLLWSEQDPDTRVVALCLESFGNPQKFSRIARRVSRTKPIVAVTGGLTVTPPAAGIPTDSAVTSRTTVEALFRQAGVIAVDGLGELVDTVTLLAHQPLPAGDRLAIVGNASGPGVLAADAADRVGLTIAELAPTTQDGLRAVLPDGAVVGGPVDTPASASGAAFEKALRLVLADPGVDGLLAIVAPNALTEPKDHLAAVAAVAARTGKPVLAVLLGQVARVATLEPADRTVCLYSLPEHAVGAFARAAGHAAWLARPIGNVSEPPGIDRDKARAIVDGALAAVPDGCWLPAEQAVDLVTAYGIPAAPALRRDSAAAAYSRMTDVPGAGTGGALVSPVPDSGVEMHIGVVHDAWPGPLLMLDLGGDHTERAYRLLPLTDMDAADLVHQLHEGRGIPNGMSGMSGMSGVNGGPAQHLTSIEDVLLRVARLVEDISDIREVDINVLSATRTGAVAVNVRIRVAHSPDAVDPTLRRLR